MITNAYVSFSPEEKKLDREMYVILSNLRLVPKISTLK